jgi:hypothetical protein
MRQSETQARKGTQRNSNGMSLLCTSSGIQAAGAGEREEAQEVKGEEEKES